MTLTLVEYWISVSSMTVGFLSSSEPHSQHCEVVSGKGENTYVNKIYETIDDTQALFVHLGKAVARSCWSRATSQALFTVLL